jgi:hypothetical protein
MAYPGVRARECRRDEAPPLERSGAGSLRPSFRTLPPSAMASLRRQCGDLVSIDSVPVDGGSVSGALPFAGWTARGASSATESPAPTVRVVSAPPVAGTPPGAPASSPAVAAPAASAPSKRRINLRPRQTRLAVCVLDAQFLENAAASGNVGDAVGGVGEPGSDLSSSASTLGYDDPAAPRIVAPLLDALEMMHARQLSPPRPRSSASLPLSRRSLCWWGYSGVELADSGASAPSRVPVWVTIS